MKSLIRFAALATLLCAAALATAQTPLLTTPDSSTQNPAAQPNDALTMDQTPTFHMRVVERRARAVNYRHRGGATKIDFRGTDLMPKAKGQARVEGKKGYVSVDVSFENIEKATTFGNEYLTYVLWAITPEGRAVNLGEVLEGDGNAKLDVTTDLQAFGMIVTAEPYYAVTQPSDLVVMENEIRPDTLGPEKVIETKYELIERGGYKPSGYNFDPVLFNTKMPVELYEAQNAMRIARLAGAEKYAAESYARADKSYRQAVEYATRKNMERKPSITVARDAIQTFEDARLIALRHREEEFQTNEREAAAAREATANAATDEEARRRAAAEAQSERAEADRRLAESQRLEEERRRKEAEQTTERTRQESQLAAEQSAREKAESDAARQAALLKQQETQRTADQQRAEAERQRQSAEASEAARRKAEQEKEALRARLLQQLNQILETRDTARGLIVNMSDVLFDSGKYALRPQAREKLAKISGIVLAYPELRLQVEGHTDSVGSEDYNQTLSLQRAQAVQQYLAKQGVAEASIGAEGFGKTQPIASNATAKGRQQNRRVELVVSGEVIGTQIGGQPAAAATEQPK